MDDENSFILTLVAFIEQTRYPSPSHVSATRDSIPSCLFVATTAPQEIFPKFELLAV
jgi:hypothetical protein